MTSTPKTLTYGDTFTLPSTPGIHWQIRDSRSHTEPTASVRAYAEPVHEDGTRYAYDEPVRIGRAEREGLTIKFTTHRAPYLNGRAWELRPTDAQCAAVDADLEALTFDLPALTAAEIIASITRYATEYTGSSAAREAVEMLRIPRGYNSTDQDFVTVRDALYADPATIPAIRAAIVAAFAAEIEGWKP